MGEVAHRLLLPLIARIHLVFHISQLKKAIGNYPIEFELPLELELNFSAIPELEVILSSRKNIKHRRGPLNGLFVRRRSQ